MAKCWGVRMERKNGDVWFIANQSLMANITDDKSKAYRYGSREKAEAVKTHIHEVIGSTFAVDVIEL